MLILKDDSDNVVHRGPCPKDLDEGTVLRHMGLLWVFSDERISDDMIFRPVTVRTVDGKYGIPKNRVDTDAAVQIAEEAFIGGYKACASNNDRDYDAGAAHQAWSNWEPSEAAKALTT